MADRGRDAPVISDGHASDGHASDGHASDGHASDAHASDGHASDAHHLVDGATDRNDARPAADGGSSGGPGPETSKCPPGRVRVHVRNIWSQGISPSLGLVSGSPAGILVVVDSGLDAFGARLDSAVDVAGGPCTYYSACIPNTNTKVNLEPMFPNGCVSVSYSSAVDISAVNRSEFWIEYTGTSSTLPADYAQTPTVPVGPGKFHVTADSSTLVAPACKIGAPPPEAPVADTIRVHFRWPWTDRSRTGYPGAACGDDALGYSPPLYPTSLAVTGPSCSLMQAFLEDQNGACTWYSALVPKNTIPTNADATLWFEYPQLSVGLRTSTITLPTMSKPANEYWIAFTGIPGVADASTAGICGALQGSNDYTVSTQNPGPAYPGCGGN